MDALLERMLESDLLLFSFPLYCYGMPAMLKNLAERMLPLSSMAMAREDGRCVHVGQREYSRLRFAMVCGCGFSNARCIFELAVAQFRLLFSEKTTILTAPESPMFSALEAEIVTAPRLGRVREAGRQYAENGEVDAALLSEIGSPMLPEETCARIVNAASSGEA